MTTRRRKAKAWSYIAGEKGKTRVRVYERPGYGCWIDIRDEDGKRIRRALGTTDRGVAKAKAEELAVQFRRESKRQPTELTLAALIDIYDREVTTRKTGARQRYERRTFPLLAQQFGWERLVRTLSRRDWDAYIAARQNGELRPAGVKARRPVRNQIIRHDLTLLGMMLSWACEAGDGYGGFLLDRNPLPIRRSSGGRGVSLPKELSAKRPVLSAKQFEDLRAAASEECSMAEAFVVLAWRTGHRANSIRHLRWTDVDLEGGRIRWAAEHDKVGREHVTPAHSEVLTVLQRERALVELTDGDLEGWIFPGLQDASKPLGRDTLNKWWQRFACAAGLPKGQHYGWHSCRRGFANRLHRAGAALKDLQGLGGWKTSATLVEVYLQADEEAQRRALALDQSAA